MRKGPWPGTWKTICDVCGIRYSSDDLKRRWDGLMVCDKDWEMKHPQLYIKVNPERIAPPWVRPEPDDQFENVCYLYGLSAYADLGQADCMQADNATFPYTFLLNLKNAAPN